ncbi:MAG: polymerase beta domain protein region protein [candidate division TM6 bacterium GW2011_GWE2_42_60]|nr:MAG: polymerase beta domain protein region protein [candidate division TM6 bacterium GW2011_GWE2_42_60]
MRSGRRFLACDRIRKKGISVIIVERKEQVAPEYKKMILEMIKSFVPEGKVILFGSRATGHARPGSDIDLTIDAGARITDGSLALLRLELEEELNVPMKIDLSDFYDLPKAFQETIVKEGIVWRS